MDVCKERGFESLRCDCLSVPLRDDVADACICIAVIHHLATEDRRLRAIKEIVRILKPGGSALIYVWAQDQFSNNQKSNYIKDDKKQDVQINTENFQSEISIVEGVPLPVHTNRTQFKNKDLLVPWKLKRNSENKGTFLRFYHVYAEHELEKVCENLNNVEIISNYYDQGNWCVMIQKINNS
ncbi:hypothetical protein HHI36_010117 [Cryptolaemus montrouzieri]|uniref:Methyltransferase type 11 domain-containing protein n=1 Tax=Cryptolaemus montrouzieri TaxID=559131 RepID=A0ABD2MHV7_9CUCU